MSIFIIVTQVDGTFQVLPFKLDSDYSTAPDPLQRRIVMGRHEGATASYVMDTRGLFATREAATEHLKRNAKHMYPTQSLSRQCC